MIFGSRPPAHLASKGTIGCDKGSEESRACPGSLPLTDRSAARPGGWSEQSEWRADRCDHMERINALAWLIWPNSGLLLGKAFYEVDRDLEFLVAALREDLGARPIGPNNLMGLPVIDKS